MGSTPPIPLPRLGPHTGLWSSISGGAWSWLPPLVVGGVWEGVADPRGGLPEV